MNIYYKVKWGDTFEKIASKFNITSDTLRYINRTTDFYVGKIIKITNFNIHITFNNKIIRRSISYCLIRHINKRRYYSF